MIDEVMLKENVGAEVDLDPSLDEGSIVDSNGKLQASKPVSNPGVIGNLHQCVSGMAALQKMGLDRQQVNDLILQIELGTRVAQICQRLR